MCYSICKVMHMLSNERFITSFSHGNRRLTGRKLCWWKVLVELEIHRSRGIRQNEYKSYILIDFAKAPENVKSYFQLHLNDLDTFYMLLSVQYGVQLYPRESAIIFDEVQLFPKAREAIKYLVADGRYDFLEPVL